MKNIMMLAVWTLAVGVLGCEKAAEKPAPKDNAPAAVSAPAPAKPSAGHGGEVIALGTSKVGAFELRASRDKGDITAGGDAPIDVWIDGGVGKGVTAVRFWIGTEDAKGSVKAKADVEDGKWHTHVEIPSPIPAGSKLWVEIEESGGKKSVTSFDLHA